MFIKIFQDKYQYFDSSFTSPEKNYEAQNGILYKQRYIKVIKLRNDTARESHEKPISNKFKNYTESHFFFFFYTFNLLTITPTLKCH